jgi:7-cyano-7-deazaguanine synthase
MRRADTLLLHAGGLRSLVATAMVVVDRQAAVVFIHDGRKSSQARHRQFVAQADHFAIADRFELSLPNLRTGPARAIGRPLQQMQILAAAADLAGQLKLPTLLWPAQVGGDFESLASISEIVGLVGQGLSLQKQVLRIDTPLAELTDQQLLEVGYQMNPPWKLSWSCETAGPQPCGSCAACMRRRIAFEEAGIDDPLDRPRTTAAR